MSKCYYNSMYLKPEQILVNLSLGIRTHQNDRDKELLKEIKKIHAKGQCVEIPGGEYITSNVPPVSLINVPPISLSNVPLKG